MDSCLPRKGGGGVEKKWNFSKDDGHGGNLYHLISVVLEMERM